MRRRSLLVVAVLLAACGGSGDDASPATTSTVAASEATPAPTETTAETTTGSTATTTATTVDEPTTAPPAATDCLIGTWRLRSQEFVDVAFAAGEGILGVTHVGGEYLITMNADGTYLGERKEWQLRLETPDGALVTTISSEDPGTYTATESEIAVSDAGGEATVRLQIDVGGTLQDLPTGGNQTVGADALSGEGTYVCSGDVLTLNVVDEGFPDGLEAVWDRVG